LGRRHGVELLAVRSAYLPDAALQLSKRTALRLYERTARAPIEALAIDAHAGGDDEAPDGLLSERLKEHRGADAVHGNVLLEAVHALSDADGGGEVDHRIDAFESAPEGVAVADITDDELDGWVEVGGAAPLLSVHLRDEAVIGADAVPCVEQLVGE